MNAPAKGGLRIAGVQICKAGDVLTDDEIKRRFELARQALWERGEAEGILPPEP